jgi:hypothetical protein
MQHHGESPLTDQKCKKRSHGLRHDERRGINPICRASAPKDAIRGDFKGPSSAQPMSKTAIRFSVLVAGSDLRLDRRPPSHPVAQRGLMETKPPPWYPVPTVEPADGNPTAGTEFQNTIRAKPPPVKRINCSAFAATAAHRRRSSGFPASTSWICSASSWP